VEDGNAIDMLKTKSGELECEVAKNKESKVLELTKLKQKWLEDSNALDELRSKVGDVYLRMKRMLWLELRLKMVN